MIIINWLKFMKRHLYISLQSPYFLFVSL
nr:unnamed protein product [Callosobruchus analis]